MYSISFLYTETTELQILREISFRDFDRNPKTDVFTIFDTLNFVNLVVSLQKVQ